VHFAFNDAWFKVLLVLHVLGAIAGIGPSFGFAVLGPLAGKLQGPPALGVLEGMHKIETSIVLPTALTLQWLTGLGLIFNRGLNHGFFSPQRGWLLAAIGIYIVIIVLAVFVDIKSMGRMIELAKAGPPGEEFEKHRKVVAGLGPVFTILTVAIIVLMVLKPGSQCGTLLRC
jgi:uncharacterized membrane protein